MANRGETPGLFVFCIIFFEADFFLVHCFDRIYHMYVLFGAFCGKIGQKRAWRKLSSAVWDHSKVPLREGTP